MSVDRRTGSRSGGTAASDGAGAAATAAASGADSTAGLTPFRERLDTIDDEIARLLGERFQICREVAVYKSVHTIPMMQPGRVQIVRRRYLDRGAEADLPADFCGELFDLLIAATCREEDVLMERLERERGRAA